MNEDGERPRGKTPKIHLELADRQWIKLKWSKIRKSQQMADDANNQWTRLNGEINRYMDESGMVDIVQRAKVKGGSLPLKDALEQGKWHAANAQRHIDDMMLFLRLRELEIL